MDLKEIQDLVFQECIANGYVKLWNKHKKIGDIAELGLIPTEVTEAQELIRNKNTDRYKLGLECADIIIRTLNFMSRKNLSADFFIQQKNQINLTRETLHGRDV